MLLFASISMGCLDLASEENEVLPEARLKLKRGESGLLQVSVVDADFPINAENVEVAFLDENCVPVPFSAGGDTTGVMLDLIYYTHLKEGEIPNDNYQVVFYDFENDMYLMGNFEKYEKDNFMVSPNLGAPNHSVEDLTLVLLWRDHEYQQRDNDEDEGWVIASMSLDINDDDCIPCLETQNTRHEEDDTFTILVVVAAFVVLVTLVIFINIYLHTKKARRQEQKKEKG